jgi:type IV secretory pathway VirB10-like protein
MQTQPSIAEDERDPLTGDAFGGYTPPNDAPIPLATPKPKVKTLDKKKVGILLSVAGVLTAVAFVTAFMPNAKQQKKPDDQQQVGTSAPSEAINALPTDYAAAAQQRAEKVPQLGPPMPGEVGQLQYTGQQQAAGQAGAYAGTSTQQPQLTPTQQYAQQIELDRLRRAADAAKANSSFGSNGNGGGGLPALPGLSSPSSPEVLAAQMMAAQAAAAGGMPGGKGGRDNANRQDDKRDFTRERGGGGTLASRVQPPATPYIVGAGTVIPALFLTGVNSDLPGQVTAQVSQPIYDSITGRHVVIPQGAVLIGSYDSRVTFGQNRVLLVWQRLRFPNGSSLDLETMPGVDLSGYAGVQDKVNNHWGKVASSVVLSSLLAGAMAVSQGNTFSALQQDAGQAAAQGAAQQVNQVGSQIVQRSINVQPTLEIRPGQRVGVMVNKDLALMPYVP